MVLVILIQTKQDDSAFPVVPKGEARIRTQISASHTEEQLQQALEIFRKVKEELTV